MFSVGWKYYIRLREITIKFSDFNFRLWRTFEGKDKEQVCMHEWVRESVWMCVQQPVDISAQ